MTYRTTRQCDQDIIGIYARGVADFGVQQAERYYEGLIAAFELLADNPRMARERTEFRPPVRLHVHRSHVIVYVIETHKTLIIRVLHRRQDWVSGTGLKTGVSVASMFSLAE